MPSTVLSFAVLSVIFLIYKYANRTETPKIKGIPEIPGVPLFGNLIQLGVEHARVAQGWVEKYGPVFQVRLGNKVSSREGVHSKGQAHTHKSSAYCVCEFLRDCQAFLDYQSISVSP